MLACRRSYFKRGWIFLQFLTSGGKLLELIDDKKIKIFKWPVNKNIFFIIINIFYIFLKSKFIKLIFYMQEVERQHGQHFLRSKLGGVKFVTTFHGTL